MVDGKPLRIIQILRAPVGGLFRHVADLTRGLADRGHQVAIVVDSLTADELTAGRLRALEPAARLGIHSMPIPRVLGGGDLTTPMRVRRLARELDAQVIHGHGAKGGTNARLVRMGDRRRVALYTPHGGMLHYRRGSPSGILFGALEKMLLPQTDALIFESAFAQQAFERAVAAPACPAPVIHNGLTPPEFEPVFSGPDATDFLFIGELRELKGIATLLDALAPLSTPDGRPATLTLVGSGPDRAKFEAQIAKLGLGDRVRMPGAQPARPSFAQGRCMIVPSLAESLPYVVLEAAAACRPLIATNVGGIPEIFGPTAGSLVPPGDTEALRSRMRSFLDDPETAEFEAETRLDFIRDRFSAETMTAAIEELYYRVIATR